MMCLRPVKINLSDEQRAVRSEKVNMPLEYRFATCIYVPCGKCEACLTNRRSQWTFRLKQELKQAESCNFITLTYDDVHLPFKHIDKFGGLCPVVSKRDVQLFLKRLRKKIQPFKIRYFLVSEYGPQTYRPHYHLLLFNFPNVLKNKLDDFLSESWDLGFIRVDPVNDARIHYVTGYCLDGSQLPDYLPKNFMLCSRRPGIGSNFCDVRGVVDYCRDNVSDMWSFSTSGGEVNRVKMPRYYRDKLFDDELRDAITIKNNEYHSRHFKEIKFLQRDWLMKEGYPITDTNLKTAFPGSPIDLQLQSKEEFRNKVRKNFKNKKNG